MNAAEGSPQGTKIIISRVVIDCIIGLRHRVLRFGLPLEAARFPDDSAATTWHFAVFPETSKTEPIGCASFMLNSFEGDAAWQLRGMVTAPEYHGRGIGRALLGHAEEAICRDSRVHFFWCNARLGAVGFYEKQGWRAVSEVFEIPTAGPHRKMIKNAVRKIADRGDVNTIP